MIIYSTGELSIRLRIASYVAIPWRWQLTCLHCDTMQLWFGNGSGRSLDFPQYSYSRTRMYYWKFINKLAERATDVVLCPFLPAC
ncbi:hypothetical protein Hanom_Chr16g01479931 [Helianthus anomalus]